MIWWTFENTAIFDSTISKPKTREELTNLGSGPIPIYHDTGTVTGEGASNDTSITVRLNIILDIMVKDDGDWVSNLWQGLGQSSEQYKNARNFGFMIADVKYETVFDKRLEITGQSLGGGLVATVTCYLDRKTLTSTSTA